MSARDWAWGIGIALGGAALVGAAVADIQAARRRPEEPPRRQAGVTVFHDPERRVTCWISPGIGMQAHGAGISCLPDATFAPPLTGEVVR